MKKWSLLFFILFGGLIYSFAKNGQPANFKIDGVVNQDSGTVYLNFYSDYLPDSTKELTAKIKDKKFSISGFIPESQGVFIVIDNNYMSSDFVIDKGSQTISINVDSVREMPVVQNNTMLEEYPGYVDFRKDVTAKRALIDQKIDYYQKLYNNDLPDSIRLIISKEQAEFYSVSDSTLLRYTEKNPNSKIAFWNFVHLMSWGYEPIFESIYNAFSETLKNGYAGGVLRANLKNSKQLSVGQVFPSFKCEDANNKSLSPDIFFKNKFTLVDFWYSRCAPCRRQFGSLRDLYKQYSGSGFEIVGISIDRIEDKKEWEDVILKEKLAWKQYWDQNGVESQRLSVKAFPTNFLVDNTGKIIYKNISMQELGELLKSHSPLLP